MTPRDIALCLALAFIGAFGIACLVPDQPAITTTTTALR
jgi:hypothetical protein